MNVNNMQVAVVATNNEDQVPAPDRTQLLLSVLEPILQYISRDVNTVKLLSGSFRFAVEKIYNPLFKIGRIFTEVISKTQNTTVKRNLERERFQLREPETFFKIEDYKNHALPIAKNFVHTLNNVCPEVEKLIDDLMKAPTIEGIEQAIELVSVVKDPSVRLNMIIFLANRALSQMTPVRSKVLLENLARIIKMATAIKNPQDRIRFMSGSLPRLIEIIPIASERISALVSIVDDLFKMGAIHEDEENTEVLRSNYHALDVAMRLLAAVPDQTLRNSGLEAFFTIFSRQIETVVKIQNDDPILRKYGHHSLFSSFYGTIQMIKALPIEDSSIATAMLRMLGFAGIRPKEETKNRFLSMLSKTFTHMRDVFGRLPDESLLFEINAMQHREFPNGIV